MTKKTTFKLAFTALVFFFAMNNANSQILVNYQDVDETIYQTTGLKLSLYAEPDMAYHPDYNYVENTGLNETAQWRWVYGFSWALLTDGEPDLAVQVKDWTTRENWVELSGTDLPPVGSPRTYWVKERFNAAGCESETATSKTVATVAVPAITGFTGAGTSSWVLEAAGVEFSFCGEGLTDEISIVLEEEGSIGGLQAYTYGITATRTAYDGNMVMIVGQEAVDMPSMGRTANLNDMTTGLTHTHDIPEMNMYEVGGKKYATKYVFSITAESLTSMISRVSHFRAGVPNSPYGVPGTTVTYWLYPTPTTGPIYHIPNNFNSY